MDYEDAQDLVEQYEEFTGVPIFKAKVEALDEKAKKEIGEALKLLNEYKDVYPGDVLKALTTLAKLIGSQEYGYGYKYPKKPGKKTKKSGAKWPSLVGFDVEKGSADELVTRLIETAMGLAEKNILLTDIVKSLKAYHSRGVKKSIDAQDDDDDIRTAKWPSLLGMGE